MPGSPVDFSERYRKRTAAQAGRTVLAAYDFKTMDPRLHSTQTGISIVPASGPTGGSSLELREVVGAWSVTGCHSLVRICVFLLT